MAQRIWMVLAILFAGTSAILAVNSRQTAGAEKTLPEVALPTGLQPGSNEMLRTKLESMDGLEIIVSDVLIPPDTAIPSHYHPGEEVAYVIEGSATQIEQGKPDRLVTAGDAFVIPLKAVHAPRGGPQGARAIVFRVHVEGQPERILVPEAE